MKTSNSRRAFSLLTALASLAWLAVVGGSSALAQDCTAPPTNLVAWWSGDGHFFDLVGTNHATAGAGVSFLPGKVGRAFKFVDAADSWIQLPNSPEFQPRNNQLTIEAWIKPDFSVAGPLKLDTILSKRDDCGDVFSYMFGIYKGFDGWLGNLWGVIPGVYPYPLVVSTKAVPDDGQFHHVAMTFDGNKPNDNCRLYLDGQIVGGADAPGAIPVTNSGPVIGKHAECGYYSSTALDELGFYNRELSAEEIQAIYHAGSAGKCQPPFPAPAGLLSWWPAENSFLDRAGTNHGVPINGVGFVPGEVGQAFDFNGVDRYVVAPPLLTNAAAFTFEWWMKVRSFTHSDYTPIFCQPCESQSPSCIPGEYWFYAGNETSYGSFRFAAVWQDGTLCDVHPVIPFGVGTWEHVAVTYDGTLVTLYWNGHVYSQQSHPGKTLGNATPLWLGKAFVPHTDGRNEITYLDGQIDEFTVYHRALDSNEIAAICAAGSAGKSTAPPVTPGLKLRLDASSVNTGDLPTNGAPVSVWRDLSGLGLDATSTGFAAPVYLANALNGRGGIDFSSSTGDALATAYTSQFNSTNATVFLVGNRADQPTHVAISGTNRTEGFLLYDQALYHQSVGFHWASRGHQDSPAGFYIQAGLFGAGASQLVNYINGVRSTNDLTFAPALDDVPDYSAVDRQAVLGWRNTYNGTNDPADNFNGVLCEIFVYDRQLSAAELDSVNLFLANKYGLPLTPIPPMLQLVPAASGAVAFRWEATPGRTYQVQTATSLSPVNWINLGRSFVAPSTAASVTNLVGAEGQQYYRILVP